MNQTNKQYVPTNKGSAYGGCSGQRLILPSAEIGANLIMNKGDDTSWSGEREGGHGNNE